LFLGWTGDDQDRVFGFARREPAHRPDEPIWYKGDGHLLTVAPTGAGKGVGLIIPTLLTWPGSCIVTDIKGENYQVTARRRREMGQQVIVLDPFNLVTDKSDGLNPFDLFELPGADLESDAEMLASQLSVGHHFTSDRYWEDTGRGLVSGLVAHLAAGKAEDRNPTNLRKLLYHDDLDYHLAVHLDARTTGCQLARDEFVSYLAAPSDRTRPCIRSTATTFVKCLGSEKVARTLTTSTFDLADLVAGKPLTVYLVIPPEKLESHRTLLRLWVGTLMTAVVRRKRLPPRRTLFLLDEVAQLGRFDLVRQAITLLRGYGLQVWTFWQDLSQLRRLYPRDWETIVSNAAVRMAFGMPCYGPRRGWSTVFGSAARQLADLDSEEMLVAMNGEKPRRCGRGNYLRDQVFSGLFDANQRFGVDEPAVG
jgi:type IV secretion system protein VirD4